MRGLDARLTGRVIRAATLRRPDLRWPIPPGFAEALTGTRVLGFRRRGKFMLMRLDTGISVLIHLGMSGRMVIDAPFAPHEHLTLETDDGARIGFVDPRRFGALDLVPTDAEDTHKLLAAMGPEPLGNAFSAPVLLEALAGKATPIKAALLDQRIVPAIKQTLIDAIAAGGSSLRDYVQPSGELGYFQHAWKVYGRTGEQCERCPGPPACAGIRCLTQTGRSSFYCPLTQR